jgi:hypothetical protein
LHSVKANPRTSLLLVAAVATVLLSPNASAHRRVERESEQNGKAVCPPQRIRARDVALEYAKIPLETAYYIIQGPRMVLEILVFGSRGEHLARGEYERIIE